MIFNKQQRHPLRITKQRLFRKDETPFSMGKRREKRCDVVNLEFHRGLSISRERRTGSN